MSISYISNLPSQEWEQHRPRSLALLGSTGSIGVNALKVVEAHPHDFRVVALGAGRNAKLLAKQALHYRPDWLAVQDTQTAENLRLLLPPSYTPTILVGHAGYETLASLPEASTVLAAQVGAAGLRGALAAARAGKVIALANKEALVLAGHLLRDIATATGAVLLPVDSEHNAIFQAMHQRMDDVRQVILTASGGPFFGKSKDFLQTVTPEQALRHPNWKMGNKISIDSATLMNKGLEVIEAHHLYGLPSDRIQVLVHPQSVIHSLVEFHDFSQLAQLGVADMRLPIAHCLNWPLCVDVGVAPLSLSAQRTLTFDECDLHSFPCLALARRALHEGSAAAVVLNAANEVAVDAFLERRIGFLAIPELVERAMDACTATSPDSIETIEMLDCQTRRQVVGWIA